MAKLEKLLFRRPRYTCPFCGSDATQHGPKTGAGGWSIHWHCKRCGAMGPKVRLWGNQWRTKEERAGLYKRAMERFYGRPEPVCSMYPHTAALA